MFFFFFGWGLWGCSSSMGESKKEMCGCGREGGEGKGGEGRGRWMLVARSK